MGNNHINRVKEKILRIFSIGTNRACVNIQPQLPGHKGRNLISSLHWEKKICYLPIWRALRTSTQPPHFISYWFTLSPVQRESQPGQSVSYHSLNPLKMASYSFGLLGFQAERVFLLYFLSQCEKDFPTLSDLSPLLLYLHPHFCLHFHFVPVTGCMNQAQGSRG